MTRAPADPHSRATDLFTPRSDRVFLAGFAILSGLYIFLLVAMLVANASHTFLGPEPVRPVLSEEFAEEHPRIAWLVSNPVGAALATREIQFAIALSLISCTITTILSLWVAVPIGYLMSRYKFRGKAFLDALLDIPIVLPPLVVGLCLLILFKYPPFAWFSYWVVFEIPAVILAQFMVACAFAVRTMRATFDQIPVRQEQVAMTLGCSRGQAFWSVVLPQARRGLVAAATLAWARSLGEFGPILIFAGSTRAAVGRSGTEVLSTTVFLEMQAGYLKGALGVSLIMIFFAVIVLVIARTFGLRRAFV